MALSTGTRIGSYEVLAPLGAGGMGEVYRARDTRLNREVAIKVLPDVFAGDPERLSRFQREAHMLAALNHPNIAHVHGFEDLGGIHALVMELVDGPTLAERIAQEPLPFAEALSIARQIAEALQAAHDQGIVHRDLKPSNVKVREDGTVKVLDFGLAKLAAPEASGVGADLLAQSPTVTTPVGTRAGVILGTAAYMSPEQAKGRAVDKRSDVWAFGAVLYEMLTARRAFEGEDVSETIANVLKSEPEWRLLPANLPPHVTRLLQACLTKDRRQRMADIAVALFVLTDHAPSAAAEQATTRPHRPLWRQLLIPAAAVIVAGAVAGTTVWLAMRPSPPRVIRFALSQTGAPPLAVDAQSRDLMITRDGTHIVYKTAAGVTGTQLMVRALDKLEPTPLMAPGVPRAPFPSPDGQWVGFIDPTPISLKKVAISGGPALLICALDGASRGATWGDDDSIIFATGLSATGLQRVSSLGGEPTILTKPDRQRGEGDHLWPQLLPGGQAVLFTITALTGGADASQVAVLDLRSPNATPKILLRGGSQAQYLASGHLVYSAGSTLRAVAFDLDRLEPIGGGVPVVSQVVTLPTGTAEFDVARDGTLVYVTGESGLAPQRKPVWVDRQGHEDAVKGVPARTYVSPRLAPDGTRLALDIRDQDSDIWVWDFARETLTRVTTDPGLDQGPEWMPDGRRLVFSSQAEGDAGGLFIKASDGAGRAERLWPSSNPARPSAVSQDGLRILFTAAHTATALDVLMLHLTKDRRVEPLVQTPFMERNPEISPGGQWLSYESNDSGQIQIYVQSFPDVRTGRWQVSTAGGTQAHWARSGRELFYLAPDGALMSVQVEAGNTWKAGPPARVIAGQQYYSGGVTNFSRTYDVAADDKRFLMIKAEGGAPSPAAAPTIVVVRNWFEELKRLVPATR